MDEEQWAQNKAQEVLQRRKQKELKDSKLVMENELKKAHTPQLWADARASMKRKVELFNKALGEEVLLWKSPKANEAIVEIKGTSHQIQAFFNFDRLDLECRLVGGGSVRYTPKVKDGQVLFFGDNVEPRTSEEIAERFVDEIVKCIC